jgi:hypothetical protein
MEILCEFGMAFVGGPVGWGAVPEDVFKIERCAVFEEEVNERLVPCPGGLMERGCVGVAAGAGTGGGRTGLIREGGGRRLRGGQGRLRWVDRCGRHAG